MTTPIKDGTEVVFRSPVDCSQITGLIVYFKENGNTASQEFALADAHGNNVGNIDHLFAENVVVKVILDVAHSMAFVQNADTNAYLEGRFDDIIDKLCPNFEKTGYLVQCEPMEGTKIVISADQVYGTYDITVCGKNLYNKTEYPCDTDGYPHKNLGHLTKSGNYKRTGFIPCSHLAGQTVTMNYAPTTATNPGMAFYEYLPDGSETDCKDAFCGGGTGANTKVPSNAVYMCFCVAVADKDKDIQIEIGSTVTEYEAYKIYGQGILAGPDEEVVVAAAPGINTVYGVDRDAAPPVSAEVMVTGKADPAAMLKRLMQAVFPATVSNEEE